MSHYVRTIQRSMASLYRSLRCGLLLTGSTAIVTGCTGIPDGVTPVTGFEAERYLGKWHEIARLDHSFERGLVDVTAVYEQSEDGSIRVLNSGTDGESGEREMAEGRAVFVGDSDVAHLKVSFFGPFYGSYVVFDLGGNYEYAFVAGFNTDYLWLLAREPRISDDLRQRFVTQARSLGFDVDNLVWLEPTN